MLQKPNKMTVNGPGGAAFGHLAPVASKLFFFLFGPLLLPRRFRCRLMCLHVDFIIINITENKFRITPLFSMLLFVWRS